MALPTFLSSSEDLSGTGVGTDLEVFLPAGYGNGTVVTICILKPSPETALVPPAGFPLIATQAFNGGSEYRVYRKAMNGSEGASVHFTITEDEQYKWVALAYNGAAPATYRVASNSSGAEFVEEWTSPSYSAVAQEVAASFIKAFTGYAIDGSSTLRSSTIDSDIVAVDRVTGPGTTDGSTVTIGGDYSGAVVVGMRPLNTRPYAPTPLWPSPGEVIDVAIDNKFRFAFDDPDFDLPRPEGPLKYEIRHKATSGSPPWTTFASANTSNQFHIFAAGTFTSGVGYVWQARFADLAGEFGDWSADAFFTGGTAPPAAAIALPTIDQDVDPLEPLTWTVAAQTAYRYRRVADDGHGAPDTSQVYFVSDPIVSSAERGPVLVAFPVNNRVEHLQHQVFNGILWSAWASRRVNVEWVRPAAPIMALTAVVDPKYPLLAPSRIRVDITNPAPAGDQPATVSNEVWVDDGDGQGLIRKAVDIPPNGSWTYETPRSGIDYEPLIKVVALGANGATAGRRLTTFILGSPTRGILGRNRLA